MPVPDIAQRQRGHSACPHSVPQYRTVGSRVAGHVPCVAALLESSAGERARARGGERARGEGGARGRGRASEGGRESEGGRRGGSGRASEGEGREREGNGWEGGCGPAVVR
eukprot:246063-Rhodomonas_salina.1